MRFILTEGGKRPRKLDCSLEDNTEVKTSDNGLVEVNDAGTGEAPLESELAHIYNTVENLFEVCRRSRGFLWISPRATERKTTGKRAVIL